MKKRTISLFLCLSLVLALTPALALSASASTNGHTQAEAVAWTNSQAGKYLDYDGAYGAQCVDLIKYYYAYLGNGKYAKGNATEYQSNALPSGWTRVTSNPQPGDVIVWGGGTKGSASWTVHKLGHVGIVVAVNGNKLTTMEQNISGSACKKMTREASYATCFIRPDFSDSKPSYPDPQPVSGKNYIIVNKASGKLLDVYGNDNSSNSKANVHIWEAVGTNKSQRFSLIKNSSGWWSIIPLSNTGLAINPSSDTPGNGTNVNVYSKDGSDITQGWYFEPVDGGYYIIHSAYDQNTVLTASGKDNKSNVQLATNAKTDYQLWKLTVDGEEAEKPHVHDYSAEVAKPTCTEKGFTTHTCKTCGDSYVDNQTPALGHSFADGVCSRCGAADPESTPDVTVSGVTVSKTALTMELGQTETLTATVEPADASDKSVTWTSSKSAVARVDGNGCVTAVAAGTADITAATTDGSYTATCRVTVKADAMKVTGVKLSKTALTMEPGQAETLTATVEPATAENTAVTWTSNAPAVASVTSGGRVTALASGAAVVTVTTDDGGFTATCRIIVKGEDKPNAVEVHFPRVNVYNDGQFTDVPANQWYTNGVKQAFEFGLMKGTGAKKFNPQGSVTIAEAIALAARIHSIYTTGAENFIPSGKWYQVYLDYAFQNGLISYAYYNSDVSKNATRAQVAEIFANALPEEALAPTNDVTDGAIPDVPMSESYASHVYKLYRAGIFTGGDVTGSFFPYTYITRQESATIVARIAESSNRLSFTLD